MCNPGSTAAIFWPSRKKCNNYISASLYQISKGGLGRKLGVIRISLTVSPATSTMCQVSRCATVNNYLRLYGLRTRSRRKRRINDLWYIYQENSKVTYKIFLVEWGGNICIFVYYDTENTWCIRYRWTEGYITWTKHKLRIAFPSSFWDASLTSNGS